MKRDPREKQDRKDILTWIRTISRGALVVLPILYAVGIAGHIIPAARQLMVTLTPYMLILTAFAGFFPVIAEQILYRSGGRQSLKIRTGQGEKQGEKNYIIEWAVLTFIITFFLEALGTATGAIFGDYQYGSTLGLHILDVPVIIGINWILIILGMISWAERIFKQPVVIIFAAAFGTTLFDFIMEPVAMQLDYWNWTGGFIPLQNYAAWWLISLVFAALYKVMRVSCRHPLPGAIVLMQAVFFLVLRITIV